MTRLMECLEAKEGVEAQYAGVYILKWRQEWGPPEYLFREVDDAHDDLVKVEQAARLFISHLDSFSGGFFPREINASIDTLRAAIALVKPTP